MYVPPRHKARSLLTNEDLFSPPPLPSSLAIHLMKCVVYLGAAERLQKWGGGGTKKRALSGGIKGHLQREISKGKYTISRHWYILLHCDYIIKDDFYILFHLIHHTRYYLSIILCSWCDGLNIYLRVSEASEEKN